MKENEHEQMKHHWIRTENETDNNQGAEIFKLLLFPRGRITT